MQDVTQRVLETSPPWGLFLSQVDGLEAAFSSLSP